MSICGNLAQATNLNASCAELGGTRSEAYVGNFSDVTFSYGADNQVTGITLPSCAKLYKVTTRDGSNEYSTEATPVSGATMFNQSVTLRGSASTLENAKGLSQLMKATRLIVILQDNGDGVDKFKVFGSDNGLMLGSGSSKSGLNPTDLNTFELVRTGASSNLPNILAPSGANTEAARLAFLENLSTFRITAGISSVDAGAANWGFNRDAFNTIVVRGCGLLQATQIVVGGRTIPLAGITSATFGAAVTATDTSWTILLSGEGGTLTTTSSTAVTATFIGGGTSSYTNPRAISVTAPAS